MVRASLLGGGGVCLADGRGLCRADRGGLCLCYTG